MFHSSYIEISKSALRSNIAFLRNQIGPKVKLSSVIKGNAYGHGIETFAPLAQSLGIDHFSVFSADEALRLLNVLQEPATIMIMGYIDTPELEWAIEHGLEFFVFDMHRLEAAISKAKQIKTPARIHIDLETGMNRTGFDEQAIQEVVHLLENNREYIQLKGLCTHYAGAESITNHERVMGQQKVFREHVTALKARGIEAERLHTACSAALMSYPESQMDMVRIGIMQYGFWPSPETRQQYLSTTKDYRDPLQRLITWKSRIMSMKQVPNGSYIGYGDTYKAEKDMLLAIVPVGYAWGYSRTLSNNGQVLIKEKFCNVVGIVNMNIMMVDITDLQNVKIDDEVVLVGTQGKESITVASFGEMSTQLNYELLTRLPVNIPRLVVE